MKEPRNLRELKRHKVSRYRSGYTVSRRDSLNDYVDYGCLE